MLNENKIMLDKKEYKMMLFDLKNFQKLKQNHQVDQY